MAGWTLIVAVAALVVHTYANEDVPQLCSDQKVPLTKISQVKAAIEQLKSGSGDDNCTPGVRQAILSIEDVITDTENDICSREKVEKIRKFHREYVSTSGDKSKSSHLPESLRNFFIAYAFKVDIACKKSMTQLLVEDSIDHLDTEDFDRLKKWASNTNNLVQRIASPKDFDDLMLIDDLVRIKSGQGINVVYIQLPEQSSKQVKYMKEVCKRRYKPFYERRILPVVELSNLGFNYKGKDIKQIESEFLKNANAHLWYMASFICEALESVEVVETGENLSENEVRLLTEEEVKELGATASSTEQNPELKQVVYTSTANNSLDDVIIDPNDKILSSLIKNYNTGAQDTTNIKKRALANLTSYIKAMLKDKSKMILSRKSGKQATDMSSALDCYIQQATKGLSRRKRGLSYHKYDKSPGEQLFCTLSKVIVWSAFIVGLVVTVCSIAKWGVFG